MSKSKQVDKNATELVTQILAGAYPELARSTNYNALQSASEAFVMEWATHADQQRFMRNTAPKTPGDDQESVGTKYPQPKPELIPAPSPDETEGTTPRKKSIPDYTDPANKPETTSDYGLKRFQAALADAADAAGKLWECARYGGAVETDEVRELRRAALDAAQELTQSLYGF